MTWNRSSNEPPLSRIFCDRKGATTNGQGNREGEEGQQAEALHQGEAKEEEGEAGVEVIAG
jgi:hypothetical protein